MPATSNPARPGRLVGVIAVLAAAVLGATGCSAAVPVQPGPSGSASPSTAQSQPSTAAPAQSPADSAPTPGITSAQRVPPKDTRTAAELSKAFVVNGIEVISKKHPINAAYRRSSVTSPHGLTKEVQAALSTMTAAARADGVTVRVRSGYRSYATQRALLAAKIAEYGDEALARRYNAAPGRSEHQTGLTVDLWDGVTWGVGIRNTRIGKWLWANAWKYGFILRYPNGKEPITGYAFEPWHYRFIGTADAKKFGANSNLTLEEYLGLA